MAGSKRPLSVRAYFATRAALMRLLRLLPAAFVGVWLGGLRPTSLELIDDEFYTGAGPGRSPIDYRSADYNTRGLFPWERAAFDDYFPSTGTLALLGAGGGREVLALNRLSYHVDGWECQRDLVESANRLLAAAGHEPSVHHIGRDVAPRVTDRTYDGVVVGWAAYSLVRGRETRVELLRGVRALVGDGAPLLISFFLRSSGDGQIRVANGVANAVRVVLGRERVEPGDYLDPNYVHYFTQTEIAAELADGGFELLELRDRPYAHAVAVAGARAPSSSSE